MPVDVQVAYACAAQGGCGTSPMDPKMSAADLLAVTDTVQRLLPARENRRLRLLHVSGSRYFRIQTALFDREVQERSARREASRRANEAHQKEVTLRAEKERIQARDAAEARDPSLRLQRLHLESLSQLQSELKGLRKDQAAAERAAIHAAAVSVAPSESGSVARNVMAVNAGVSALKNVLSLF
jgi:hypothetical protein